MDDAENSQRSPVALLPARNPRDPRSNGWCVALARNGGGMVNLKEVTGNGDAGMEERCENRTKTAAPNSAKSGPVPQTTSESLLWRDYLTSVLNIPIIRQEIEHDIQTAA